MAPAGLFSFWEAGRGMQAETKGSPIELPILRSFSETVLPDTLLSSCWLAPGHMTTVGSKDSWEA